MVSIVIPMKDTELPRNPPKRPRHPDVIAARSRDSSLHHCVDHNLRNGNYCRYHRAVDQIDSRVGGEQDHGESYERQTAPTDM